MPGLNGVCLVLIALLRQLPFADSIADRCYGAWLQELEPEKQSPTAISPEYHPMLDGMMTDDRVVEWTKTAEATAFRLYVRHLVSDRIGSKRGAGCCARMEPSKSHRAALSWQPQSHCRDLGYRKQFGRDGGHSARSLR